MVMVMLFAATSAHGLDESRLWLPVKYQKLYLELKAAAEAAESLDNCSEVLKGVIDLERSEPEHPIFRILCRRPDGISYNEMVDGLSKETLTTQVVPERELTEEELEVLRLEEERRIAQERAHRKAQFNQACNTAFVEATGLMIDRQRLSPEKLEPVSFDDVQAVYRIAFNATSIGGAPLEYVAVCQVEMGDAEALQVEIELKSRR